MKQTEVTKYLRYQFSPAELREKSEKLAGAVNELTDIEARKAQVTADLAAEIKSKRGEVTDLARQIHSGNEYRNLPCYVKFHQPENGWKRIYRSDTHEQVGEERMNDAEMQEQLPFVDKMTELVREGKDVLVEMDAETGERTVSERKSQAVGA